MKTGYPEGILKHCLNMKDENRKNKEQVELKVNMKARSFLSATLATEN